MAEGAQTVHVDPDFRAEVTTRLYYPAVYEPSRHEGPGAPQYGFIGEASALDADVRGSLPVKFNDGLGMLTFRAHGPWRPEVDAELGRDWLAMEFLRAQARNLRPDAAILRGALCRVELVGRPYSQIMAAHPQAAFPSYIRPGHRKVWATRITVLRGPSR